MKKSVNKYFLSVIGVLFVSLLSAQTIYLVDNTATAPSGPNVFNNLQDAVDATSPGDIIHVKPSAASYGTITITEANDSISIYGIGYNPEKEIEQLSVISEIRINGRNLKLSGFRVTGATYIRYSTTGETGNISLENNQHESTVYVGWNGSVSNILIRNSLFLGQLFAYQNNVNAVVISNSIFSYTSNTTGGQVEVNDGTLISHCLFFGDGGERNAFLNIRNSSVSNCIFYGRSPQVVTNFENVSFSNCFAEQSYNTDFPTGNGNSLSGIIPSISGNVFQDTTIALQLGWNKAWQVDLDPASTELIGGGDNGTDVGLTGGSLPYNEAGTPLPYIRRMIVPSVIRQGDDLDVTIEATSGGN